MVVHVPKGGTLEYDNRKLTSKRNYLRCVLSRMTIFGGGCKQFKSNGPQSYYAALLKDPLTEPGLPAIRYDEKLKSLEDGASAPPELRQIVPFRTRRQIVAPVDPDIDGGDVDVPPPPAVVDGDGSSSDSNISSSKAPLSDHAGDEETDGADVSDPYPVEINGVLVKRETHQGRGDSGLRITCTNPEHGLCTCYRSTKLWTDEFGMEAPVLFLKTWMAKSFSMDAATHRRWRPGRRDIRLFVLSEAAV